MSVGPKHPPRRGFRLRHPVLVVVSTLVAVPALIPVSVADAAPAVRAQVRVDQVGYAADASKRAYLMTSVARPGASFRVVDAAGGVAYASVIGADQGSWSTTYAHVYALDFDAVHRTGSFHIVVSDGSVQVGSPVFRIDTAARIYAKAMTNSLSF